MSMTNRTNMTTPGFTVGWANAAAIAVICASLAGATIPTTQTAPMPNADRPAPAFLLEPGVGRAIGLETVWQSKVFLGANPHASALFITEGDSVFVVDDGCHLSRVLIANGSTVWSHGCGRATDRVLDVDRAQYIARLSAGRNGELTPPTALDEVLVTLDAAIASFDAHSGNLTQTQQLERFPTTRSIVHGRYLIFGARGGQLVWQQYAIGHLWKCNEVGGAILSRPIVVGDSIAAASTTGDILVVDPDTTRQVWRGKTAGAIKGSLAEGGGAVYAASADQSIHAFESATGKLRWRHLAGVPLECDLYCDGERVYAQIPGQGLVALLSRPAGMLESMVSWKASVPGNAICRVGHRLLVWDQPTTTLTALDAATGLVEGRATLPSCVALELSSFVDPSIFLLGADGTVQRLDAIVMPGSAAE